MNLGNNFLNKYTRLYFVLYCQECKLGFYESKVKSYSYWNEAWPEIMSLAVKFAGHNECPRCKVHNGSAKATIDFKRDLGISLVDPALRIQYKPSEIIKNETIGKYTPAHRK